jgi:glutamate dehydrogenase
MSFRKSQKNQKKKESDKHSPVFQSLKRAIDDRFSASRATLLNHFAEAYLAFVAEEDLRHKTVENILGGVLTMWNLVERRRPREIRVRVYNPSLEKDHWTSAHTIVEVSMDNMPFLVDSIRLELERRGLTVHEMISTGGLAVVRDTTHRVIRILSRHAISADAFNEAPIYAEIDRQTDPLVLKALQKALINVLKEVTCVVSDQSRMRELVFATLSEMSRIKEQREASEFLKWLLDDHFLFLGTQARLGKRVLDSKTGTALGLFRQKNLNQKPLSLGLEKTSSAPMIQFEKVPQRSRVHRDKYMDVIHVMLKNEKGQYIGERQWVGFFTNTSHYQPTEIPWVRQKIMRILDRSGLTLSGHTGKALRAILNRLPWNDLLQAKEEELLRLGLQILQWQEKQDAHVFTREDRAHSFFSCLVFVPRSSMSMELRAQIQTVLMRELQGDSVSLKTLFTDSKLVWNHFMVHGRATVVSIKALTQKVAQLCHSWLDDFNAELLKTYGETLGASYVSRYRQAFPLGYRETVSVSDAMLDISRLERLNSDQPLSVNFYAPENCGNRVHLRLYHLHHTVPLSDAFPILHNMGFRFIDERPYEVRLPEGQSCWINDYELECATAIEADRVKPLIEEAFLALWTRQVENDELNKLILIAQLSWREVMMLRAYAKYFHQIKFPFTFSYIAETLICYPAITRDLVQLFCARFDPQERKSADMANKRATKIMAALDRVLSLDQDKILCRYVEIIQATVRTNYFKEGERLTISFKFECAKIPQLPLPYPLFEIFVYATRFEGVHLRGARVARGGIRWSDRREDFRTEVLGLMKAQQVKNSVIVPLGAKGGFVLKTTSINREREAQEAIACYQFFIESLLEITDNIVKQKIISPHSVVCYDAPDPYLVVAADKGTATFSNRANAISQEFGFWLQDAFASGGSTGYDHKALGITARGAWESVQRHFRALGLNTQTEDFTVVGIGDLSGDVFGNGMLLSKHIRLIAAFNHQHIFIDPNPNPATSYAERARVAKLSRSSWADYRVSQISAGGGVFLRSAKSIAISAEMKKVFELDKDKLAPSELIQAILKARYDLLFNGGIGTYIKSSTETQADVGDRANDALRVNASELRCRVIAEGGNLGVTQLARVEYELKGGRVYTDFIDNSGGVDCSDHEVNMKILLNAIVAQGRLTEQARNRLMVSMTDQVANLVLRNNYRQTQAIELSYQKSCHQGELYLRLIHDWTMDGRINPRVDGLPDAQELSRRQTITRPEFAVLHAHAKTFLKEEILASDIPEDAHLSQIVWEEFPSLLRRKYDEDIKSHRLYREIIATQLCNRIIDQMGITFIPRLQEETGASTADIIRAWEVARIVYQSDQLLESIEALDFIVDSPEQLRSMQEIQHLLRRATRWLLRHQHGYEIPDVVRRYQSSAALMGRRGLSFLSKARRERVAQTIQSLVEHHVPGPLAEKIGLCNEWLVVFDLVEIIEATHEELSSVAKAYFETGDWLKITWLRDQLELYPAKTWVAILAKSVHREELDRLHRQLVLKILRQKKGKTFNQVVGQWEKSSLSLKRFLAFIAKIQASPVTDLTVFTIVFKELAHLL